ncbi:MAG: amino acid permease [Deltaproteobacteria bacterium]|nr:amino acid permease [Deltaproteobacteria bacterium]
MGTGAQGELKRVLSFWDVFFIAVGQIIGAGVIALTGVAIGMTGPSVTIAYFGAALLVLIASALYMMAGATLPSIGAFYVWPARLCNGWLGSIVLMLILLASITLGLYGSSFGLYLNPLFPVLSANMWGVVAIVIFFVANLFGLNLASKVQMALVVVLISALAVYAGFAMPDLQAANLTPMFPKGVVGFLTAIFLLKFATGGAYLIVVLGGEMKNPQRDIPLVLIISTLSVAVIYGFVALASVGVIPWEKMINQPLTVAGKAFLPGWAFMYFLIAGAGLAICTTLNAQFIQLPRNFIVASWDNLIPKWMGRVNKYGAPHFILIAMLIIGVVPLLAGLDIGSIARAATISATLPGFILYWAITRIPKKFPEEYKNSLFKFNRFWIWVFFTLSQISMLIGVILLSRGLSKLVLGTLLTWIVFSIAYYPLRRSFLRRKGIDLDALTSDPAVMKMT